MTATTVFTAVLLFIGGLLSGWDLHKDAIAKDQQALITTARLEGARAALANLPPPKRCGWQDLFPTSLEQ